jgi:hypothetical protein
MRSGLAILPLLPTTSLFVLIICMLVFRKFAESVNPELTLISSKLATEGPDNSTGTYANKGGLISC